MFCENIIFSPFHFALPFLFSLWYVSVWRKKLTGCFEFCNGHDEEYVKMALILHLAEYHTMSNQLKNWKSGYFCRRYQRNSVCANIMSRRSTIDPTQTVKTCQTCYFRKHFIIIINQAKRSITMLKC